MADYSDAVELARQLIRCPSVTPAEGGALDLLEAEFTSLGFHCTRLPFGEGDEQIDNLFATIGDGHPHIAFAGHTDVVPPGNLESWQFEPFSAEIKDGRLYGRGAADMKGGIAAFVAAVKAALAQSELIGRLSFIITGDEEAAAINGTVKMVDWMKQNGHIPDFCILGEPTNPDMLGDVIKNGRRGSLTGRLTVQGSQGHVAYPHMANNPVPAMMAMLTQVNSTTLDDGNRYFDPSTAEIVNIHIDNPADNVIPDTVFSQFNIRFNTEHSAQSLETMLKAHFDKIAAEYNVSYEAEFRSNASPFITEAGEMTQMMITAIEAETGRRPELSTTGGTSDARFICNLCDVAEFGLVGRTMHKIDEHVAIEDIDSLCAIYGRMLTLSGVIR